MNTPSRPPPVVTLAPEALDESPPRNVIDLGFALERHRNEAREHTRRTVVAMINTAADSLDWAEIMSGQDVAAAKAAVRALGRLIEGLSLVELLEVADELGVKK